MSKRKKYKDNEEVNSSEDMSGAIKKKGARDIQTEAPDSRFQTNQQVDKTGDFKSAKSDKSVDVTIREHTVPEQRYNTVKTSSVKNDDKIAGGSSNSAISGVGLKAAASYSGKEGSIAGDISGTPIVGQPDRSSSRSGKKQDSTVKKVNYLINEQVTVEYSESKPLAEARDEVQGYNGSYRNLHARTQKRSGGVPADLYFDRSVDEYQKDFFYPIFGQYVTSAADKSKQTLKDVNEGEENPNVTGVTLSPLNESPSLTYNKATGLYEAYTNTRGSYLPKTLTIAVDKDGQIVKMQYAVTDVSAKGVDAVVADHASMNAIIDANQAEIDRQNMDVKAGDENSEGWSELPRAVKQPTQTVGFLRDIEAMTGSEVYMAFKKTAAASSYQLNKAGKDGQRVVGPIAEMFHGNMAGAKAVAANVSSEPESLDGIFHKDQYLTGSPALMIDVFDSKRKYKTKADVLLQPRGIRLHLNTASNNMAPLRLPKKFVEAVMNNEVFSTIGYEYDPFLPVMISDKAALILPYDPSKFMDITKGTENHTNFTYNFTNMRNNYNVEVEHPLYYGIKDFIESIGAQLYELCGADDIVIPIQHSTTCFSLWSLIVLAATPYILRRRTNSMISVLDYENNFEYPFSQLITIREADPQSAVNYINADTAEPLVVKQMNPSAAIRWAFGENFWQVDEKAANNEYHVVLPWYFNEDQFELVDGLMKLKDEPAAMSFPSLRSGTRLSILDSLYNMSEREVRLSLDRMVVPPMYGTHSCYSIYKYGVNTDGIPMVSYFGDKGDDTLTWDKVVATPRELGFIIPAPGGTLTANTSGVKYGTTVASGPLHSGFVSFRLRSWFGGDAIEAPENEILTPLAVNVNRAMSLRQIYLTIFAQDLGANDYADFGFIPSMSELFVANDDGYSAAVGRSLFIPFTDVDGVTQLTDSAYRVGSLQKALWFFTQRMTLAINPFECILRRGAGEDALKFDPYDFLYYNGVAGFRASDYNEDIYNRLKRRIDEGLLFLSDPFVEDSPIFK